MIRGFSLQKAPVLATVLGLISIASAMLIGFISYRTTFQRSEEASQQFYLCKAQLLAAVIEKINPEWKDLYEEIVQ